MVTQQDREEWIYHPVTVELVEFLKESRQATLEEWGKERYVAATGEQTLQMNAKALGGMDFLNKLLDHLDSFKPVEPTHEEQGVHDDTNSY